METMLMAAYESLGKVLLENGSEHAQAETVRDAMDFLWASMDADEITALQSKAKKSE